MDSFDKAEVNFGGDSFDNPFDDSLIEKGETAQNNNFLEDQGEEDFKQQIDDTDPEIVENAAAY